jgi:hypothetical protein
LVSNSCLLTIVAPCSQKLVVPLTFLKKIMWQCHEWFHGSNFICCFQCRGRKSDAKKEEIDAKEEVDDDQGVVKRDLDDDDDDTDDKEDAKEEADVRDIRYNLETLPLWK